MTWQLERDPCDYSDLSPLDLSKPDFILGLSAAVESSLLLLFSSCTSGAAKSTMPGQAILEPEAKRKICNTDPVFISVRHGFWGDIKLDFKFKVPPLNFVPKARTLLASQEFPPALLHET